MAIALSQLTIQASLDATNYVAGANAKAAADAKMVDSGDKFAASVTATEQKLSTAASSVDRLAKSIDPAFAAQTRLAQGTATLNRALDSGSITQQRHADLLTLLVQRYQAAPAPIDATTRAFGLNRQGLMELQAAGVNAFQALASGMGAFRVAETEGAQVIGAFAQGGKLSIATLVGWVAPLAAVAAGVALITSTIVESNSQLRTFNTILSGMGTASLSSAAGLQNVVKSLRDTGTAAADALAAVQAVTRTQGINPAAGNVSMITNLARDIGAVTGGSIVDESKKLSEALAAGEVSAEKFAFSLAGPNGLTAAEAASAQAMAKHGDNAGALGVIIGALQRQFGGQFKDSLSEFGKAIDAIAASWRGLLEGFADSSAIKSALQAITDYYKSAPEAIANLLNMPKPTAAVEARIMAGRYGGRGDVGGFSPAPAAAGMSAAESQADLIAGLRARGYSDAEIAAVTGGGNVVPFPTRAGVTGPGAGIGGLAMGGIAQALATGDTSKLPGYPQQSGIAGLTGPVTIDAPKLNEAAAALNRVAEANKDAETASAKFGIEQKAAEAYTRAFTAAINAGKDATSAEAAGTEAARHARADANIELAKSATLADLAAQGALKIVDGYRQSTEAGLQAAASVKARNDALTTGVSYEEAYARALTESADAALTAAAQRYAAGQASLTSNQAVAAAAQQGAAAEREAQIQALAAAQTQDALAKARATGNAALVDAAQKLTDETAAQIKANEAAQASIALSNQTHDLADRQQVLQLELSLQGQTSDEIAKQVALLQAKQAIEKSGLPITDETAQNYIRQTGALADVNTALNQAQRSQQQLEDGVRGIADTIDQSIGQSIQDAFDNKKTLDWGQTIRNVLAQIVNQIAQIALIRPAIGSILSVLGFQNASQQFGTFGSLLNSLGGAGGGSSAAGGGGINTGTLLQGGGLLKDVFGLGSGGISGGINSFGSSFLGLANPALQGPTLSGATLGETGLLGATSLSSLAGGPAGGFAAGSLQKGIIG